MSISTHIIPKTQFVFTDIEGLHWTEQSITLTTSDLGLSKVSIELTTDAYGWVTLKELGLFEYTPEICGPILGGGFNPAKPYYITVDLHSNHLTLLGILYDNEDVDAWFVSDAVQSVIANSRNFVLISTMQPITSKTQWGMTTTYSTSHHN
jgi:hypothetical protein